MKPDYDNTFTAIDPQDPECRYCDNREFTCESYERAGGDLAKLRQDAERHGDGDLVRTIDSYNASGVQGTAARADMAGDYAAKFCLSLPEGMVLSLIHI